jgi:hypothetical protein
MRVLGEFHDAVGRLVKRFDATVGFLEGDGVQLFFNDPIEIPDFALKAGRRDVPSATRWPPLPRSMSPRSAPPRAVRVSTAKRGSPLSRLSFPAPV